MAAFSFKLGDVCLCFAFLALDLFDFGEELEAEQDEIGLWHHFQAGVKLPFPDRIDRVYDHILFPLA